MNPRTVPQRRGFAHAWPWLVVVILICLLLAVPRAASAQTVLPRPGVTDPAANFSKWPDDEIFVSTPVLTQEASTPYFKLLEMSHDLASMSPVSSTPVSQVSGTDAVSGHFLAAGAESIALAYRSGTGVEVRFSNISTASATLPTLMNRVVCSTDYFDLAYGDLDGLPAGDVLEGRDEIAVAYVAESASQPYPVKVAVLNFGRTSTLPAATVSTATAPATASLGSIDICSPPRYNLVTVATGDFDANGVQEIAVATITAPDKITIDIFRYSATRNIYTGAIQGALKALGQSSIQVTGATFTSLSAVAGDFDADGKDELALATSHHTSAARVTKTWVFRVTGDPYPAPSLAREVTVSTVDKHSTPARVEIATGLFKVNLADPTQRLTTNRRQLVVAYRGASTPDTDLVDASTDLNVQTISLDNSLVAMISPARRSPDHDPHGGFWLASGGFKGSMDSSGPTWSLALTTWDKSAWGLAVLHADAPDAAPALKYWREWGSPAIQHMLAPPRLALAATDHDGDTVYLGAPVHFTVDNLISTDFILQEPPKHAYWDKDATIPEIKNVSRIDAFNVQLVSESQTRFETTRTDTADFGVGGSLSATLGFTATAGANIGVAKASASASTTVSAKVGYDYEQHESEFFSAGGSITTGYSGTTNRDDYLVARTQLIDVWRYRVYGLEEPNPEDPAHPVYPYFDIVLPGPSSYLESSGSALNFDWYQPTHENGNILSYPRHTAQTQTPADLGSFTVPPDTTVRSGMMYPPTQKFCDQNSSTNYLTFTTESGGGSQRSYSHTLNSSASVQSQATVSAEAFGSSAGASASYGVELHGNTSWGGVATSSNKTSASTGITLNQVPSCEGGSQAYAFYPLIYTASDGTIKVSFAVNPTGSDQGDQFWMSYYNLPDLALNLPKRFIGTSDGVWKPRLNDERNEIRGFFMRSYEKDPATGGYALLSGAVIDGTKVRLEARVSNYSVQGTVPAGGQACFSYVAYDQLNNVEGATRTPILPCASLPALTPQEMVMATVVWDTSGLSLQGAQQDYRIYVNLIPPMGVIEKYPAETEASRVYCGYDPAAPTVEVCVDPGQNNEGWRLVTVAPQPRQSTPGLPVPPSHVGMPENGLAAIDRGGEIVTGVVRATVNEPLMVRATVVSDTPSTAFGTVLVYDGHPDEGGELIAGKRVFIGSDDPEGAAVWFSWVPPTRGQHLLFAKVLQSANDSAPGGNTATLTVNVIGPVQYLPLILR